MNTNQLTLRERNETEALSRTVRRWTYAISVFVVGSLLYFTRHL